MNDSEAKEVTKLATKTQDMRLNIACDTCHPFKYTQPENWKTGVQYFSMKTGKFEVFTGKEEWAGRYL